MVPLLIFKDYDGIEEIRAIDEVKSRLPHSEESHTFHGRDIYAYNGARLAVGETTFEELGSPIEPDTLVTLPLIEESQTGTILRGSIDVLDVRFGSLWSNISSDSLKRINVKPRATVCKSLSIIKRIKSIKIFCYLLVHLRMSISVSHLFILIHLSMLG